jgi:hypothetical protein
LQILLHREMRIQALQGLSPLYQPF